MKDRYNQLLSKITERKPESDKFIEVLHEQRSWLTSPASTKYHLNKEGDLLEYSSGVAETLLRTLDTPYTEIGDENSFEKIKKIKRLC